VNSKEKENENLIIYNGDSNQDSNDYNNDKILNEYWNSINSINNSSNKNYKNIHKRIKSCHNYRKNNNNKTMNYTINSNQDNYNINNKTQIIEIKKNLNNKFYTREYRSDNSLNPTSNNKAIKAKTFSNRKLNKNNMNKNLSNISHIRNKNISNNNISIFYTRNTNSSHLSDFSFMTSNNSSLEEIKNRLKEKLISITEGLHSELMIYSGPVNLSCLSLKNYDESVIDLVKKIKKNGYQYSRVSDNLFTCSKGDKVVDVEIVKIKGNLIYYLIKK
jgi:hypothetical protein